MLWILQKREDVYVVKSKLEPFSKCMQYEQVEKKVRTMPMEHIPMRQSLVSLQGLSISRIHLFL